MSNLKHCQLLALMRELIQQSQWSIKEFHTQNGKDGMRSSKGLIPVISTGVLPKGINTKTYRSQEDQPIV